MSNNIAQLEIYFKSRIWRPNTFSQNMFLLQGYLITGISFLFFSLFFPFYKLTYILQRMWGEKTGKEPWMWVSVLANLVSLDLHQGHWSLSGTCQDQLSHIHAIQSTSPGPMARGWACCSSREVGWQPMPLGPVLPGGEAALP